MTSNMCDTRRTRGDPHAGLQCQPRAVDTADPRVGLQCDTTVAATQDPHAGLQCQLPCHARLTHADPPAYADPPGLPGCQA
jgi:hypothetical protein